VLPEWISEQTAARAAPRRRHTGYLSRSLRDMARVVEDAIFCEQSARRAGFLQRLDARVKLFSVLALAVGATFLHHLPSLLALGVFALAMLLVSRVGLGTVFSRSWWVMPAVFALVAVPSVLSVFVPGDPLVALPWGLSITRQGVASAAVLVTRIAAGMMLALMLALTTRWQELLRAAYTGVTAPFVLVATMMYRYVFVLLRVAENMHLARRARTIVPLDAAQERRWVGGRVGALFLRSRRLSEQVYSAMLARGYRGEPKVLVRHAVGARELAWVLGCAVFLAGILVFDRAVLGEMAW